MLLAVTSALFLIASSFVLSVDPSVHHQHVAARRINRRCIKSNSTIVHPASHPPPPKGKVGIAFPPGGNVDHLKYFITEKVSAIYNWGADKPPDIYGLEYAPMLWGQSQISDFQMVAKRGYADVALGFNEPDLAGQSSIDPVTAANIWMKDIQPLKNLGYQLITPAVASQTTWLQSFFAACKKCTFDHMAVHIYALTSEEVINQLTNLHNMFGLTIWVTEFACQRFPTDGPQCDESQVFSFMTNLIEWMDKTDWIVKYFYFALMDAEQLEAQMVNGLNAIMNPDGTPTKLGKLYIGG